MRALRSGCDSHLGGVCSGRHPMPYWFLCPRQTARQWQQVLLGGRPPAAALKGTI